MIVVALFENARGKEVHHLESVRSLSRVSLHPSFKARALETCSILEDKETMASIKQSEKDAKAGKVRDARALQSLNNKLQDFIILL